MKSQSEIRKSITDQIVEALKSGSVPFWRKPWVDGEQTGFPTNAVSGRRYRGVNVLLLSLGSFQSKWFATYAQWRALGGQVRRGERGTSVILYKPVAKSKINDDGEMEVSTFPLITSFVVFNLSQVDGDLQRFRQPVVSTRNSTFENFSPAEEVFTATGADIRFGGNKAYFSPSKDFIQIPHKSAFPRSSEFYSTLAHEFIHWTGHESRLNRLDKFSRFGDEDYCVEELTAELGSCMLSNELGVPQSDEFSNFAAYLASWLKVLQRDHTAIFAVSAAAQLAVDYILSFSRSDAEEVDVEEDSVSV